LWSCHIGVGGGMCPSRLEAGISDKRESREKAWNLTHKRQVNIYLGLRRRGKELQLCKRRGSAGRATNYRTKKGGTKGIRGG